MTLMPTNLNDYKLNEDKEYAYLLKMPNDFNPKDPERIAIFCIRMRQTRESLLYGDGVENNRFRQNKVARELCVEPMTLCKWEKYDKNSDGSISTAIKSIPMDRLRRICGIYGVTPHYLLGYVDEPYKVLIFNEDGSVDILETPATFRPLYEVQCIEAYTNMATSNPDLYQLINKVLLSNQKTQEVCKDALKLIFKHI